MKPCFSKRQPIAWLALGELDARRAQELEAHIATCDGCRQYLAEMSGVRDRLTAQQTEPEIEAAVSFHRGLVSRLRAERSVPPWEILAAWLSSRLALPAVGVATAAILILCFVRRQPVVPPAVQVARPVAVPAATSDLSPTIANYQRAASHSFEDLDELLTRQASRSLPPAHIYTASIFAVAGSFD